LSCGETHHDFASLEGNSPNLPNCADHADIPLLRFSIHRLKTNITDLAVTRVNRCEMTPLPSFSHLIETTEVRAT